MIFVIEMNDGVVQGVDVFSDTESQDARSHYGNLLYENNAAIGPHDEDYWNDGNGYSLQYFQKY